MYVRVLHGFIEIGEHVVLVRQAVECADRREARGRCSGLGPFNSTVMPRRSSTLTISPSACAPVASSTWRCGSRRITTRTSAIAVSSTRNRFAAPKNKRTVELVCDDVLGKQRVLVVATHLSAAELE